MYVVPAGIRVHAWLRGARLRGPAATSAPVPPVVIVPQ